jgi:hypothetical protein
MGGRNGSCCDVGNGVKDWLCVSVRVTDVDSFSKRRQYERCN